jgi:hypothetical protein
LIESTFFVDMLVKVGVPQNQNQVLLGLARLLRQVLPNPALVVIPPIGQAEELISDAVDIVDEINFPSFPSEKALAVGLCLLSTHLSEGIIDLTLLVSHFLAFDAKCLLVDAEFESDTILSFLVDLIEHHMVPL